jgi:type VI secretion system secreted protein Hcp
MKDNSGKSVDGSVDVAGREKNVEVLEFEHEVRMPTDPDTSKLTDTRKHEAIRLLKAIDASSSYLYKAVLRVEVPTTFFLLHLP